MNGQSQNSKNSKKASANVPVSIHEKSLDEKTAEPAGKIESEHATKLKDQAKEQIIGTADELANFTDTLHEYILDQILLADQKATFLFAAVSTMLAYLHSKGITKLWIKDPRQWLFSETLVFVAVAGLFFGALASFLVIVPRLRGAPRGIIFWKSISLFESRREYVEHILSIAPRMLISVKLEHCHELAQICKQKYSAVSAGIWCGGVGLLASVLYLALS